MEFKSTKIIPSTPSQTAWALLSLMAGGENLATKRGVEFLLNHATETLRWPTIPASGFPEYSIKILGDTSLF